MNNFKAFTFILVFTSLLISSSAFAMNKPGNDSNDDFHGSSHILVASQKESNGNSDRHKNIVIINDGFDDIFEPKECKLAMEKEATRKIPFIPAMPDFTNEEIVVGSPIFVSPESLKNEPLKENPLESRICKVEFGTRNDSPKKE